MPKKGRKPITEFEKPDLTASEFASYLKKEKKKRKKTKGGLTKAVESTPITGSN